MKNSRHFAPQVNAGSMADIAFLLLIFFLVTTTISADKGINRRLPEICPPGTDCSPEIQQRNILQISINGNDEILVKDAIVSIKDLKQAAKDFLDNNGDNTCSYCNGFKDTNASDNPSKAVISLSNDPQTSYEMYIAVQDILTKAYYELREDYAKNVLGKTSKEVTENDLKEIKKAYPFILSEAETKKL
ncbi:MAG: biopolymer transporter ExbD [Gelidibacter sp.]